MTLPNYSATSWGCDVPVSMPVPIDTTDDDIVVDMGSHVFTENGLRLNVNQATLQETFAPTYAPPEAT